jgi:hypothetical protein
MKRQFPLSFPREVEGERERGTFLLLKIRCIKHIEIGTEERERDGALWSKRTGLKKRERGKKRWRKGEK